MSPAAPVTDAEIVALAKWVVRTMFRPHNRALPEDWDDDTQAASEGICRALQSWDPAKGEFSTHAVWCARSAISRDRIRRFHGGRRGWDDVFRRGESVPDPVSLSAPVSGDDGVTWGEWLAENSGPAEGESWWTADLDRLLGLLADADRICVTHAAADAAELLGIKRESVRRRRVRIYARLREQVAS